MKKCTHPELVEAQRKLCERDNIPMFMPSSGLCYHCKGDLTVKDDGSPRENLRTAHLTGCRVGCMKSYCD